MHLILLCKVFDPFMYLSVPLPEAKTRSVPALVWTKDLSKLPVKYLFEVPKHGTIQVRFACFLLLCLHSSLSLAQEFVDEVAKVAGIDGSKTHVCDVYSGKFFKQFKRDEPVSSISERDVIYVIETEVGPKVRR